MNNDIKQIAQLVSEADRDELQELVLQLAETFPASNDQIILALSKGKALSRALIEEARRSLKNEQKKIEEEYEKAWKETVFSSRDQRRVEGEFSVRLCQDVRDLFKANLTRLAELEDTDAMLVLLELCLKGLQGPWKMEKNQLEQGALSLYESLEPYSAKFSRPQNERLEQIRQNFHQKVNN